MHDLRVALASGDSFDVKRFAVTSAINRPYEIEVIATTPGLALDFEQLIGRPASFGFQSTSRLVVGPMHLGIPDVRAWRGVCAAIDQVAVDDATLSHVAIKIVPELWLLGHRKNHRIFQYMSEVDIALEILTEWGIAPALRVDRATHKLRKFVVQYDETDLAFVNRMLEQAGVTYTFDSSEEAGGLMTLDDAPERSAPRGRPLRYVEKVVTDYGVEYATKLESYRRVAPGKVFLRDHDYRKAPSYQLAASAKGGAAGESRLEVFEYREAMFLFASPEGGSSMADARGVSRTDEGEAAALAQRRLLAARAEAGGTRFETNVFDIDAGSVVRIVEHAREELDRDGVLVLEARYSGTATGDWKLSCSGTSAASPFKPPLRTPRPYVGGIESATVVGPATEEIHCDEFGRVKIHFHWDRESKMDDASSCWVHVSQSWGGASYGGSQLPRIGQEVVVEFLGGDPDRPIIVGRVYTALQPTPYKLPDGKTQSGLKSNSTNGTGGYNEIFFEDKAGQELFRVQAEKDYEKLVKNDESTTIRRDRQRLVMRDETLTVGGNRKRLVDKDETLTVSGNRTRLVEKNETVKIDGNRTRTVLENEQLTVSGNRNRTVKRNESMSVGGNRTQRVRGNSSRSIGASEVISIAKSLSTSVGLMRSTSVGLTDSTTAGLSYAVSVTPPVGALAAKAGGPAGSMAAGAMAKAAGGVPTTFTMKHKELVLSTGSGASITLKGDTVTIVAKKLVVNGEVTEMTGKTIDLQGDMIHINKTNSWPAGRLRDVAPDKIMDGAATVLIGGPTVKEVIEAARKAALAMLDKTEAALKRWNEEDKKNFREWFGSDSEATRQQMQDRIDKARENIKNVNFEPAELGFDKANSVYAYVYPGKDNTVYLGRVFFDAPATGIDSQAGTIVHESSHFNTVGGTADHDYGPDSNRTLATTNPTQAQNNADSFEHWVESVGSP